MHHSHHLNFGPADCACHRHKGHHLIAVCVNGAPGPGLCTNSMAIHGGPVCIVKPPWQKPTLIYFTFSAQHQ